MQHSILPFASTSAGQFSPARLPSPLTSLLGREHELTQLTALLRRPDVRLLTLTGPGGVGKTRLGLAVAHDLLPTFAGGICFVSLAAISDPDFVLPAIAQTLGVREVGARSVLEELQAAISFQSLLLLLDNFEQVLAAAPRLSDLLTACPHLHLLVSSRAALRLSGEQEFAVSPLPVPNLTPLSTPEALAQYAALTLFVQRAQAITPDFQMTAANARTIAEICVRLDGLPLAIELAAARTRLLSPQALLSRLSHRLEVLTGGARDVPDRQQTMRATIAWSYHLLMPQHQKLFRVLSIFAGGCTLQAVEAIAKLAEGEGSTVLDEVGVLLENHLLRQATQSDGEPRLLFLETIREYGLAMLANMGELEATRDAHAAYYLALAEEAEPQLRGGEQDRWVTLLECELENIRTALRFLLEQAHLSLLPPKDHAQAERALRLCVALSRFWHDRGYGREGVSFLMQALAVRAKVGAALRARVLYEAVYLADIYARELPLESLIEESLALYQELDDPVGIVNSLYQQGSVARIRSQFALASACLKEAAARYQDLGDRWRQGQCATEWARVATEQGQVEQARTLLEDGMLLYQELGDQQRVAWVRYLLARLFFVSQQDLTLARALAEQSLAHFQAQNDLFYSAAPLGLLGLMHLQDGDLVAARPLLEASRAIDKQIGAETEDMQIAFGLARLLALESNEAAARRLYQESLTLLFTFTVHKENIAAGLEGLADLEARQGKPEQAARLWGAAIALREAIGAPMHQIYRTSFEQALTLARTTLGEQVFATAWAEGHGMTIEQALATQVSVTGEDAPLLPSSAVLPSSSDPGELTRREREILRLLAQGLTNKEMAEQLVVSLPTIKTHVASIFNKLGVNSRSAATRYALDHHLA